VSIDTKQKRQSALLETCGMLFPDTVIDSGDRIELLGLYSGVEVSASDITGTLDVTLDAVTCESTAETSVVVTTPGGGFVKAFGRPRPRIKLPRPKGRLEVTLDDCTLDARGHLVDLVTIRLDDEFIRQNFEETAARYLREQIEEEDELMALGVL